MSKWLNWICLLLCFTACLKKSKSPNEHPQKPKVMASEANDSLDEVVLTPEGREALLIQAASTLVTGVAWIGATTYNGKTTDFKGFMDETAMSELWLEMKSALSAGQKNQTPTGILRFVGCHEGKIGWGQVGLVLQPPVPGDARGVKECGYLVTQLNEQKPVGVEFTLSGGLGDTRQRVTVKLLGNRSAVFEAVKPLPPWVYMLIRHSPEAQEMTANPFPTQIKFDPKVGFRAFQALGLNPLFYTTYPTSAADMSHMWAKALANGQLMAVLGKAVEVGFLYLNVNAFIYALKNLKQLQSHALVNNSLLSVVNKSGKGIDVLLNHRKNMMQKFNWKGGKFQWQAKMAWAYFQVITQGTGSLSIFLRLMGARQQIEKMEEGPAKQGLMSSFNTLTFVATGLDLLDFSVVVVGGVKNLGRFGVNVGGKTFHYLANLPFMVQNAFRVVFEQRAIHAYKVAFQKTDGKLDLKEFSKFKRWLNENGSAEIKERWERILNILEKNFAPTGPHVKNVYGTIEREAQLLVESFKLHLAKAQ